MASAHAPRASSAEGDGPKPQATTVRVPKLRACARDVVQDGQEPGLPTPVGQEGEVGVPAFPKGNALWSSKGSGSLRLSKEARRSALSPATRTILSKGLGLGLRVVRFRERWKSCKRRWIRLWLTGIPFLWSSLVIRR